MCVCVCVSVLDDVVRLMLESCVRVVSVKLRDMCFHSREEFENLFTCYYIRIIQAFQVIQVI